MSECCSCGGNEEKYKELQSYIDSFEDTSGRLIGVLHKAQEIFGYLPRPVQEYVAMAMDLPLAKVYGVVKFYSFFTMSPKGKYPISVCMGTACYVRGAEAIVEALEKKLGIRVGQVTSDGLFSLDTLRCVGACGLAPVMIVAGHVYGRVIPEDVPGIIDEYLCKDRESEEKVTEGVCCHG